LVRSGCQQAAFDYVPRIERLSRIERLTRHNLSASIHLPFRRSNAGTLMSRHADSPTAVLPSADDELRKLVDDACARIEAELNRTCTVPRAKDI